MITIRQMLATVGASSALAVGAQTPEKSQTDRLQASLEEIVVTAQKRQEDLQNVPISIAVVNSKAIERNAVRTVTDLSKIVPNVSFEAAFSEAQSSRITVRGITGSARNSGFESGVSVYVDGVYAGRPGTQNVNLMNVERVEVLRGPQGTLFGKNTVAGAINVITRSPGEEFEGKVTANIGNFEKRSLNGYVSGPLVEGTLFAGASFFGNDRDGYVKNLYNGEKLGTEGNYGGDLKLRYVGGSSFEANLRFNYLKDDSEQTYVESLDGTSNIPGGVVYSPGIRTINLDGIPGQEREIYGASLTLDYEMGSHTLTSITAYNNAEVHVWSDNDNAPLDFLYGPRTSDLVEFASQELRLASPAGERFDYLLGLYLFDQQISNVWPFIAGVAHPLPGLATVYVDVDTRSAAGFLHANYHLTDKLTFTGGVRYTKEWKEMNNYHAVGPVGFGGVFHFPAVNAERTDSDVSPMLSISYAINEAINVYVKGARGFKSGGWNADFLSRPDHTPPPVSDLDFDPETATTYELGFKSELLQRRLLLNIAVFQTDYEDLQVQRRILDPASNLFLSVFDNAASSTIRGGELDFQARVTEGLSLRGGVGYTDAKYDSYAGAAIVNGVPVSFDGNELPDAPEWNGFFGVDYEHVLVNDKAISVSFDYSYKGDFYTDPSNRADLLVASSGLLGGRIGLVADSYEFFLWGENLANKDYLLTRQPGTVLRGTWNMPRTYGVQMSYKF